MKSNCLFVFGGGGIIFCFPAVVFFSDPSFEHLRERFIDFSQAKNGQSQIFGVSHSATFFKGIYVV